MKLLNRLKNLRFLLIPFLLGTGLLWLNGPNMAGSFDPSAFNEARVMEHIRFLSSPECAGRMAGSQGNNRAVQYVREHFKALGIAPVPGSTYEQKFKTLVPNYGEGSVFQYQTGAGEAVSFQLYRDYRMYSSGYGGSIDFNGDLLFVDMSLYNLPKEMLKDRVVIMTSASLTDGAIEYVIENGAKGLFSYIYNYGVDTEALVKMKSTSVFGKKGPVLGLGVISRSMYTALKLEAEKNPITFEGGPRGSDVVGLIPKASVMQEMAFEAVEVSNVLGMIPGKKQDEYLLIGGHLDHVGKAPDGTHFPGALDNASGTAMMMELARMCAEQGIYPEKTIIFAAWNAEENGLNGSGYYVKNPPVPLEQTEVINLDMVGGVGKDTILVGLGNEESQVLGSRILQLGEDISLDIETTKMDGSDHVSFARTGNRAIMVHQGDMYLHQQEDTLENIDPENLKKVGALMGALIKRDANGESRPDYLGSAEKKGISLFLITLLVAYGIEIWWLNFPDARLAGIQAETLYFSSAYRIGRKLLLITVPTAIVIILIMISQLPRDLNLISFGGHWDTNFSGYLTFKKTLLYIRGILESGLGNTAGGGDVAEVIRKAFLNSMKLLGSAILLALPLGVLKGLFDAWSSRKESEGRSFSSVLLLSVPDILWILMAFSFMIMAGNNEELAEVLPVAYLRGWLLPLVTLAVMPAIYISRIAFVGFRHELNRPYITALKAKGASKARIFFRHLLNPVWERSLSAMQGLIAVLISNLIVIEYLFDYKGLANYILQADKAQDNHTFVSLILCLTVLYVVMILLCRLFGRVTVAHRKGSRL